MSKDIYFSNDFPNEPSELKFLEENDCQILVGSINLANVDLPKSFEKITHIYDDVMLQNISQPQIGGNLSAFSKLIAISGDVDSIETDKLHDDTFPLLTSIGGSLEFTFSPMQQNLNVFSKLRSIGHNLIITNNSMLKNIDALLDNLDILGGDEVFVHVNNQELDECYVLAKLGTIPNFSAEVFLSSHELCL